MKPNNVPTFFERNQDFLVHAAYDWSYGQLEIRMLQRHGLNGRLTSHALPVVMEDVKQEDAGRVVQPMMRLSQDQAQQFMDQLWHCGIRPTEGQGSSGQLAAVQKHLDDMRALAFGTLELQQPGDK